MVVWFFVFIGLIVAVLAESGSSAKEADLWTRIQSSPVKTGFDGSWRFRCLQWSQDSLILSNFIVNFRNQGDSEARHGSCEDTTAQWDQPKREIEPAAAGFKGVPNDWWETVMWTTKSKSPLAFFFRTKRDPSKMRPQRGFSHSGKNKGASEPLRWSSVQVSLVNNRGHDWCGWTRGCLRDNSPWSTETFQRVGYIRPCSQPGCFGVFLGGGPAACEVGNPQDSREGQGEGEAYFVARDARDQGRQWRVFQRQHQQLRPCSQRDCKLVLEDIENRDACPVTWIHYVGRLGLSADDHLEHDAWLGEDWRIQQRVNNDGTGCQRICIPCEAKWHLCASIFHSHLQLASHDLLPEAWRFQQRLVCFWDQLMSKMHSAWSSNLHQSWWPFLEGHTGWSAIYLDNGLVPRAGTGTCASFSLRSPTWCSVLNSRALQRMTVAALLFMWMTFCFVEMHSIGVRHFSRSFQRSSKSVILNCKVWAVKSVFSREPWDAWAMVWLWYQVQVLARSLRFSNCILEKDGCKRFHATNPSRSKMFPVLWMPRTHLPSGQSLAHACIWPRIALIFDLWSKSSVVQWVAPFWHHFNVSGSLWVSEDDIRSLLDFGETPAWTRTLEEQRQMLDFGRALGIQIGHPTRAIGVFQAAACTCSMDTPCLGAAELRESSVWCWTACACINFVRWDFSAKMPGVFDWSCGGPFPFHRFLLCSTALLCDKALTKSNAFLTRFSGSSSGWWKEK